MAIKSSSKDKNWGDITVDFFINLKKRRLRAELAAEKARLKDLEFYDTEKELQTLNNICKGYLYMYFPEEYVAEKLTNALYGGSFDLKVFNVTDKSIENDTHVAHWNEILKDFTKDGGNIATNIDNETVWKIFTEPAPQKNEKGEIIKIVENPLAKKLGIKIEDKKQFLENPKDFIQERLKTYSNSQEAKDAFKQSFGKPIDKIECNDITAMGYQNFKNNYISVMHEQGVASTFLAHPALLKEPNGKLYVPDNVIDGEDKIYHIDKLNKSDVIEMQRNVTLSELNKKVHMSRGGNSLDSAELENQESTIIEAINNDPELSILGQEEKNSIAKEINAELQLTNEMIQTNIEQRLENDGQELVSPLASTEIKENKVDEPEQKEVQSISYENNINQVREEALIIVNEFDNMEADEKVEFMDNYRDDFSNIEGLSVAICLPESDLRDCVIAQSIDSFIENSVNPENAVQQIIQNGNINSGQVQTAQNTMQRIQEEAVEINEQSNEMEL